MKWKVVARPQVVVDIIAASEWYNSKREGLGDEFIEEVLSVLDALEINPLLHSRRDDTKNIRWRYPKRFPYRVIYEVVQAERLVIIAAVLHTARRETMWRERVT